MKGFNLYKNVLTSKDSRRLYGFINKQKWDDKSITKISHDTIHYGYIQGKGYKTLSEAKRETPNVLICMAKALYDLEVLSEHPNQIIINKYTTGQTIKDHTDHDRCFGNDIAIVSLGSNVKMTFKEKNGNRLEKIDLPINSLITLTGDARYKWTRVIEKNDSKQIDKKIPMITIVFRRVTDCLKIIVKGYSLIPEEKGGSPEYRETIIELTEVPNDIMSFYISQTSKSGKSFFDQEDYNPLKVVTEDVSNAWDINLIGIEDVIGDGPWDNYQLIHKDEEGNVTEDPYIGDYIWNLIRDYSVSPFKETHIINIDDRTVETFGPKAGKTLRKFSYKV